MDQQHAQHTYVEAQNPQLATPQYNRQESTVQYYVNHHSTQESDRHQKDTATGAVGKEAPYKPLRSQTQTSCSMLPILKPLTMAHILKAHQTT